MAAPTFASMAGGYRAMWSTMKITRVAACEAAARKIMAGRSRYLEVEKATGVPWFFIGMLHMRESSCNFAGVLHNGEHIIGTGRKTRLVPAGRGPFTSWVEAAIDALKLKSLHKIALWGVDRLGYESERFNGFGYIARRVNSPYVWAGSNHYTAGKYVADGVFSAGHVDTQLGTLPVLKALCDLSPEVRRRVGAPVSRAPEVTTTVGGGGAVVGVGISQGWGFTEWVIAAVVVAVLIGLVVYVVGRKRKQEPTDLPPISNNPEIIDQRGGAAEEN